MTIRNLDKLFRPASVAIVGATERPHTVGAALMHNVLQAGFKGPIYPVNLKGGTLHGLSVYPDIASLPAAPDLAVIATPPDSVPSLIAELGARGTRGAVVLTAGFGEGEVSKGKDRAARLLTEARPYLLRVVGPNCLGIAVPGIGLNATFAPAAALPGNIAFLTQSGAMATTVMDWALPRGIGFSAIVSMGDMSDVDFGDLLDYFALDEATQAILIYAEGVTQARKFMSAARKAARIKPVIVVKGGRAAEGAKAASSHTGALAGADNIYEAAFRRAGMLRVDEVEELFDAATTLAHMSSQRGKRLAILTNGGGAGVLATDRLIKEGGTLAAISPATMAALDKVLPPTWSRGNPVDIIGDADAARYRNAIDILIKDDSNDGLLIAYCPTAIASSADAAKGVVDALAPLGAHKNVFVCWMGEASVRDSRAELIAAKLPYYETPERAVRAFMHLVRYHESQSLLLETPAALAPSAPDRIARARDIVAATLADGREWLDPAEVAAFMSCYDIPFVRTQAVPDAAAAAAFAAEVERPIALKIRSRDIIHKSDVGGVALNLVGRDEVMAAAKRMIERVKAAMPKARFEGFIVQEMIERPNAIELIAGVTTDPTFGPVILFGHGGTAAEIVNDESLELPPLNTALAGALIGRTQIAKLLKGYRDRPPSDIDGVVDVLVQLGRIVADHPQVTELDINPFLCDPAGVIAVDGRVRVRAAAASAERTADRLAIRPYPDRFESDLDAGDAVFRVRPIRPEDEPALTRFAQEVDDRDLWHPSFASLRERTHETTARLSQIDYDREMTLVAWQGDRVAGLARAIADPDFDRAECAVIIRADLRELGLATRLLGKLTDVIAAQGVRAAVLIYPATLRQLDAISAELGFAPAPLPGDATRIAAVKQLT